MSKRTLFFIVGAFAILLIQPLSRAVVRNAAFVSLERQAIQPDWSGWGLGLKNIARESLISATGSQTKAEWLSGARTGVSSTGVEGLLAMIGGCEDRRVIAATRMSLGDFDTARSLLSDVVLSCPEYRFAYVELGLALDRLDRPIEAAKAFEAGGVSPYARELAAADYLEATRPCSSTVVDQREQCLTDLRHGLQLAPGHVAFEVRLAMLLGRSPAPDSLDPDISPLWDDRRLNDSVVETFANLAQHAGTHEALFVLARRFGSTGDRGLDEATAIYQRILADEPDNARAAYLKALLAGKQADWQGSASSLLAPPGPSVDTSQWYSALGRALSRLGNEAGARGAYEAALTGDPCTPEALFYVSTTRPPAQLDECISKLTVRLDASQLATIGGQTVTDELAQSGVALEGTGDYLVYGPYQSLHAGTYEVVFRLRTDSPVLNNCLLLDISDPTDKNDGLWLAPLPSKYLQPRDLPPKQYAEFTLGFSTSGGGRLEYRVRVLCAARVGVDWIEVRPVAP